MFIGTSCIMRRLILKGGVMKIKNKYYASLVDEQKISVIGLSEEQRLESISNTLANLSIENQSVKPIKKGLTATLVANFKKAFENTCEKITITS